MYTFIDQCNNEKRSAATTAVIWSPSNGCPEINTFVFSIKFAHLQHKMCSPPSNDKCLCTIPCIQSIPYYTSSTTFSLFNVRNYHMLYELYSCFSFVARLQWPTCTILAYILSITLAEIVRQSWEITCTGPSILTGLSCSLTSISQLTAAIRDVWCVARATGNLAHWVCVCRACACVCVCVVYIRPVNPRNK